VQHECIPQAILGMDVICQAKSGMGKTAVFVLSSLHQLEAKEGQIGAIVLCHTRELAFQINNEFERFSRYLPDVKVKVFYGGVPVPEHKRILKSECPHIIVGTPGRVLQLVRDKDLVTKNVKHFILDECDKMLEKLDMRSDVQEIFKSTPHEKQVMMFSATLSTEMRTVCKKFMQAAAARTYGAPPPPSWRRDCGARLLRARGLTTCPSRLLSGSPTTSFCPPPWAASGAARVAAAPARPHEPLRFAPRPAPLRCPSLHRQMCGSGNSLVAWNGAVGGRSAHEAGRGAVRQRPAVPADLRGVGDCGMAVRS